MGLPLLGRVEQMNRSYRSVAPKIFAVVLLTVSSCGRNTPRPLVTGATVEVYLVAPASTANTKELDAPDGKSQLYVTMPSVLSTADIATVNRSDTSQEPSLNFKMTPAGAKKLLTATASAKGQQLAVVVNGHTISVAKIHSALSDSINISGGLIYKDCDDMVDALTRK